MTNRPKSDEYYKVRKRQFDHWFSGMRKAGSDIVRSSAWQGWLSAWDIVSYMLCPRCTGTGEIDSGAPDPQGNWIEIRCPDCEDGLLQIE